MTKVEPATPLPTGVFFEKLPPAGPTLLQRWNRADEMNRAAIRASHSGQEYALEEQQAADAENLFWQALENETGLTRAMLEQRL